MAWCPGCSYEYKPSTRKKCPACGQMLQKGPGLSKAVEFENREWFAIRAADDAAQAEILRSFLESNGFDVAVRNGNGVTRSRSGKVEPVRSGIHILVPADCASRAARLVRSTGGWVAHRAYFSDDKEPGIVEDYDLEEDDLDILHSNGITVEYDDEYFSY